MKYVVVQTPLLPMAIIVPEVVQHKDAVNPKVNPPLSAGFFSVENGRVMVGKQPSESLGLGPRPEDAEIIATTLAVNGFKGVTR